MNIITTIANKLRSTKLVTGFLVVTSVAAIGASGAVSATPGYFDVDKPSAQRICYKQLGVGWKKAGFRNLDHCLRYVSTEAPEAKSDCEGGWWFVYGFNSYWQCAEWVATHGGGYSAAVR